MRTKTTFAVLTLALAPAGAAFAADYYVAPPGTVESCTPDGSQACPWIGLWPALNNVLQAGGTGGDRLLLLDGDYGLLSIYNFNFSYPVVVQSLNGKNAHLDQIYLVGTTQNITFRDLSVWPTDPHQPTNTGMLVNALSTTSNIIVDGLDVRNGQDAENYMSWSQSEWLSRQRSGIMLSGDNSVVENSTVTGLLAGIQIAGQNSSIINNKVDGHASDAYRVLGDNSLAEGNYSQNCFQINADHLDGLQTWADADGILSNVTIKNNKFIEWASSSTNPLRCHLQGISFFDGPYENIVIQNNVLSLTDYHGIAVYGGHNVQILNNTVVNNDGVDTYYPWIYVADQKNGALPSNILVANNLAMQIKNDANMDSSILTTSDNSVILDAAADFQDISTYNYIPTPGSGFIDTADPAYAPATDITGAPRPAGNGPDRGAYEYGAVAPVTPGGSDGTIGSGTGTATTIGHGGWKAKFLAAKKLRN